MKQIILLDKSTLQLFNFIREAFKSFYLICVRVGELFIAVCHEAKASEVSVLLLVLES